MDPCGNPQEISGSKKVVLNIYKKYPFRKIWFKPFYSAFGELDDFKFLSQNLMIYSVKYLV